MELDMKEEIESHSPNPEETDENIQYIIVNPRSLSDDESGSNKKRPRWEYWETKTLIDLMKEQNDVSVSDKSKARTKDNFFLLEQEMRKRGIKRWDSSQIQQKWRNLRKDWVNTRTSNYRNGESKTTSEFQGEMDELLGTPPSNCSLSGVDTTSGDEIMGYEVETLEPADHVTVIIDNGDKRSRASPSSHSGQKFRQESKHNAKPSTSSEDGQDVDSIHEPVKEKKLKKKDASKGKGSYSAALAAFATNIAERQESLIRTMMDEARKTAIQEAKRQQEYERKLMMEHTTLLTTQLRKIITENTQATLQGIKLLMDLNQQMGVANMHTAITATAGRSTFVSAPPGQPVIPATVPMQACLGQETSTAAEDLDTSVPVFECVVGTSSSAPPLCVLDRPHSFKETTE